MYIVTIMLCIIAFALLYRMRGGLWAFGGTQVTRVVYWALPVGLTFGGLALHAGLPLSEVIFQTIVSGIWAFLGLLVPHGKYIGQYDSRWQMSVIMFGRCWVICSPLSVFVPSAICFPVFGAFAGIAYWMGWKFLNGKKTFIAENGAEWGEVLTGAAFGLGIATIGLLA